MKPVVICRWRSWGRATCSSVSSVVRALCVHPHVFWGQKIPWYQRQRFVSCRTRVGRGCRRGSGRDDGLVLLLSLRFPRLCPCQRVCQMRSRGASWFGTGDVVADGVSRAYWYC